MRQGSKIRGDNDQISKENDMDRSIPSGMKGPVAPFRPWVMTKSLEGLTKLQFCKEWYKLLVKTEVGVERRPYL